MSEKARSSCQKCGCISFDAKWCRRCYYPGIDEDYEDYLAMLDEGFSPADAAVRSGWCGAEEI